MAEEPKFVSTILSAHSFGVEPFVSMRDAAAILGLPYHLIQRAARKGTFPAYRFGRRIRVRVSELEAVIERSKTGGAV